MILIDYIFNKLPSYFHQHDSYKDNAGDGLLKRFLRVNEDELNTYVIPKLEELINLVDPSTCPEPLLKHLAYNIGSPINLLQDIIGFEFFYGNYLRYAHTINRIKGTVQSYEILFAIMGYKVNLPILEELSYSYDTEEPDVMYDGEGVNYDSDFCPPCGRYGIILSAISTPPRVPLTDVNINLINSIVNYLQPADMKFTEGALIIVVDANGDLVYHNSTSNSITFELDINGDLIVIGPNAEQYSIVNGDLIRTV